MSRVQSDLFSDGNEVYAEVVFDLPIKKAYHYRIPKPLRKAVMPGCRVRAQFGRQVLVGYCTALTDRAEVDRVRDLLELVDREPLISLSILELTKWISDYYFCGWGEALNAALPAPVRADRTARKQKFLSLAIDPADIPDIINKDLSRSPKQARTLDIIRTMPGSVTMKDIIERAECTPEVIRSLCNKGLLNVIEKVPSTHSYTSIKRKRTDDLPLLEAQQSAFDKFLPIIEEKKFGVMLLHGVTGSGKTEVYLQLLRRVIEQGRQGLVLVPEISLTPQTIDRFLSRFPRVAVLHSMMSDSERNWEWRRIKKGEADVVIGTRSAVFAPLENLGIVIIDEEYDTSFKQESPAPRYHARDVAIMRAQKSGACVLLGSATPSLESYYNAAVTKKYSYAKISERVLKRPLPPVKLIDMNNELTESKKVPLLSNAMVKEIRDRLARKEQVILFLNRRGFHTIAMCVRCNLVFKCPNCDISLTHHRKRGLLVCHHCDYHIPAPRKCPECFADTVRFYGIGTERVEKVVKDIFPEARVERMDSDVMLGRGAHREMLSRFSDGEIDILIGTQMIGKGLDFHNVTLVGVVSADTILNLPDFRAGERTFQLITQVAGRTGRGPLGGIVIVQSMNTGNYIIRFAQAHDFDNFAKKELLDREKLMLPPFSRCVRIVVSGKDEALVRQHMKKLGEAFKTVKTRDARIQGPMPAPISKLQTLHRWHIMFYAKERALISRVLSSNRDILHSGKDVAVTVDIDPVWML